jgi:hypothetical protein
MDELDRYARICRVQRVLRPYLEALNRVTNPNEGLARSVQVRLAAHAKAIGSIRTSCSRGTAWSGSSDRLSRSQHAERFVLEGALLLMAWLGETLRPTRDADLLGFGDLPDDELASILRRRTALSPSSPMPWSSCPTP